MRRRFAFWLVCLLAAAARARSTAQHDGSLHTGHHDAGCNACAAC